jgi:hypothetical protein
MGLLVILTFILLLLFYRLFFVDDTRPPAPTNKPKQIQAIRDPVTGALCYKSLYKKLSSVTKPPPPTNSTIKTDGKPKQQQKDDMPGLQQLLEQSPPVVVGVDKPKRPDDIQGFKQSQDLVEDPVFGEIPREILQRWAKANEQKRQERMKNSSATTPSAKKPPIRRLNCRRLYKNNKILRHDKWKWLINSLVILHYIALYNII